MQGSWFGVCGSQNALKQDQVSDKGIGLVRLCAEGCFLPKISTATRPQKAFLCCLMWSFQSILPSLETSWILDDFVLLLALWESQLMELGKVHCNGGRDRAPRVTLMESGTSVSPNSAPT